MSINTPASKDVKNEALDLKTNQTSPLMVNVQIMWPVSLIINLSKAYYLFLPCLEGTGAGLRCGFNTSQVLIPTLPSTPKLFAL